MRTLGIIGGLGPLAGAHFYKRLVEMTPADSDADHLSAVLISDPDIPSRLMHLAGQGPSPVSRLVAVARRLEAVGADVLAMPSTTTSYYHADIQAAISVPLISLVDAVREALERDGIGTVGILATTPTRTYHIYEAAFAGAHMQYVYPDAETQTRVMSIIASVKGTGNPEVEAEMLARCIGADWAEPADAVLLGCTELPVVWDRQTSLRDALARPVYSATDILAHRALELLRGLTG